MLDAILFAEFLGKAAWIWYAFILAVIALLAFDLGVMNRSDHEIGVGESLRMSAFYIGIGLAFSGVIWLLYNNASPTGSIDPQLLEVTGTERAWTAWQLYLTGFAVEKTLAMDNVFVISMVFTYLAIPRKYQHRVLFFALAAMVHRFKYLKYALAMTLVFIGSKIFLGDLFPSGKFPAEWSLSITMALIAGGVLFSLWKTRKDAEGSA